MLIQHNREKLLNAITFFANNLEKVGKIKLFKLLYFLDFEHYKLTGRNVTGLDYYAWKMGPVPLELFNEIESPEPDMAEVLRYKEIPVRNGKATMLNIETKKDFDPSFFSKRELKIMQALADQYKTALADDMVEATHLESLPWHKVYNIDNNKHALIPYELAFRSQEKEMMTKVAQDHQEIIKNFSKATA